VLFRLEIVKEWLNGTVTETCGDERVGEIMTIEVLEKLEKLSVADIECGRN
jgi:hypothetical protein